MTAREKIKEFLKGRKGYVQSSEVHDYIVTLGYLRTSSAGSLAKMAERGEILRIGGHHDTAVKLNPEYRPTTASVRQTANHAHLGRLMGRVPVKPKQMRENAVFDLCRKHSRMYQLIDQPLREVRL